MALPNPEALQCGCCAPLGLQVEPAGLPKECKQGGFNRSVLNGCFSSAWR